MNVFLIKKRVRSYYKLNQFSLIKHRIKKALISECLFLLCIKKMEFVDPVDSKEYKDATALSNKVVLKIKTISS